MDLELSSLDPPLAAFGQFYNNLLIQTAVLFVMLRLRSTVT